MRRPALPPASFRVAQRSLMAKPAPPGSQRTPIPPVPGRSTRPPSVPTTAVTPIRVALGCVHRIMCAGVSSLLTGEDDFQLVGQATDGPSVTRMAVASLADIVVLDYSVFESISPPRLSELRAAPSKPRVILLAAPGDHDHVLGLLREGAWGVVSKDSPPDHLVRSIRAAAAGEAWVDRETVSHLLASIHDHEGAPETTVRRLLTPREMEIVAEVAHGASNVEIGNKLGLRAQTVKNRLSGIFDKLGVSSRLELALYAVQLRLDGRDRPDGV